MILCRSKITCYTLTKVLGRRFSTPICLPPPAEPIVTILDSLSTVGSNLAFLLKQHPLVKELRVYDEQENTLGLAEDLNSIDTRTCIRSFSCRAMKDAIKGAHIVISTGDCQCKSGQTQKELFAKNIDNVRNAAIFLSEFNPAAIFCIAKPPVEALVPMVTEEYKKTETYDPRKIIGVTTPFSVIASTMIAEHLKVDPGCLYCPIIGGMSPVSTVPVISQARPKLEYNSKVYAQLQEEIANAEETLLTKGSPMCYSNALAITRFINLLLKAFRGERNCVECAYVAQTGHIGDLLPYMTSIVQLGPQGVSSTHMPRTNELEIARLKAAVPHILENILLGQTFLHGDFDLPFKPRKVCDEVLKQKVQECNQRANM
ncbi:hypothetical protein Zmor_010825 [Zophobas morio]|uniref:Malate dehydrogenase, mitochondrial n=1 Tax=Zophobas morio TaxID=2755281 RepID=A0AA38IPC7_9CUCU|nr:hypothetical protein Zmor_010825 [Zophobas morio]